jgi:uncharacterized phage protein (TIGR01671 family)
MREIKSRAWDKKNKWMWQPASIDMWIAMDGRLYEEPNKRYDTPHTEITRSPDHYELMQFTGLKDANGKEIFEGDLLRSIEHDELYRVDDMIPAHRHAHVTNIGFFRDGKYHARVVGARYDNDD